jgi:uncharacterized protein (TIGR03086 family)
METLELLDGAYTSTGRIIAKLTADQLGTPTPCRDWDVRRLLNHTIGAIGSFTATASRTKAQDREDWVGKDPVASYEDATKTNLAAWSAPGALEGACTMPNGMELPASVAASINFIDSLVHGWDLATALHLDSTLDPELATAALEVSRMVIQDGFRGPGKGFGYVVEVPAGASPTEQLVAFMGRQP